MKRNILMPLLHAEWLNFKREKSLLVFFILMLAAGLYGIYAGNTEIQRQKVKIARLETLCRDNVEEMKAKYPDSADAGDIGYYHSAFAKNMPNSWSAMSIGQRDANPYYIKLRLLAVQNQLYSSENNNPDKLAAGTFDLAFVFVYLLPLFIIAVSFNVYSAEKERGTLGSMLSQPVSLSALLFAKFLFRLLLVLVLTAVLSILGVALSGAQADARFLLWLGAGTLYSLFWFGVCYFIVVLKRNSAFNAVALLGCWLLLTVILPVSINMIAQIRQPVTEGLRLTLKQREEVHAGWDRPKEQTMQRFFQYYPQYSKTGKSESHFKWKWYYAFQELGDRSVDGLYHAYTNKLNVRNQLASGLAQASPPAAYQLLLNALCGTDLRSQADFSKSALAYHNQLKAFYYPFLFNEKPFRHDDFAQEPEHLYWSGPDLHTAYRNLFALAMATFIIYAAALALRRIITTDIR